MQWKWKGWTSWWEKESHKEEQNEKEEEKGSNKHSGWREGDFIHIQMLLIFREAAEKKEKKLVAQIFFRASKKVIFSFFVASITTLWFIVNFDFTKITFCIKV